MSFEDSGNESDVEAQGGPKLPTWSDEEDTKIIQLHMVIGTRWTGYSKVLPHRPENAIKNRWNSTTRRVTRYEVSLKKQGLNALKPEIENQLLFKYCRQVRARSDPNALLLDTNGLTLLDISVLNQANQPATAPQSGKKKTTKSNNKLISDLSELEFPPVIASTTPAIPVLTEQELVASSYEQHASYIASPPAPPRKQAKHSTVRPPKEASSSLAVVTRQRQAQESRGDQGGLSAAPAQGLSQIAGYNALPPAPAAPRRGSSKRVLLATENQSQSIFPNNNNTNNKNAHSDNFSSHDGTPTPAVLTNQQSATNGNNSFLQSHTSSLFSNLTHQSSNSQPQSVFSTLQQQQQQQQQPFSALQTPGSNPFISLLHTTSTSSTTTSAAATITSLNPLNNATHQQSDDILHQNKRQRTSHQHTSSNQSSLSSSIFPPFTSTLAGKPTLGLPNPTNFIGKSPALSQVTSPSLSRSASNHQQSALSLLGSNPPTSSTTSASSSTFTFPQHQHQQGSTLPLIHLGNNPPTGSSTYLNSLLNSTTKPGTGFPSLPTISSGPTSAIHTANHTPPFHPNNTAFLSTNLNSHIGSTLSSLSSAPSSTIHMQQPHSTNSLPSSTPHTFSFSLAQPAQQTSSSTTNSLHNALQSHFHSTTNSSSANTTNTTNTNSTLGSTTTNTTTSHNQNLQSATSFLSPMSNLPLSSSSILALHPPTMQNQNNTHTLITPTTIIPGNSFSAHNLSNASTPIPISTLNSNSLDHPTTLSRTPSESNQFKPLSFQPNALSSIGSQPLSLSASATATNMMKFSRHSSPMAGPIATNSTVFDFASLPQLPPLHNPPPPSSTSSTSHLNHAVMNKNASVYNAVSAAVSQGLLGNPKGFVASSRHSTPAQTPLVTTKTPPKDNTPSVTTQLPSNQQQASKQTQPTPIPSGNNTGDTTAKNGDNDGEHSDDGDIFIPASVQMRTPAPNLTILQGKPQQ